MFLGQVGEEVAKAAMVLWAQRAQSAGILNKMIDGLILRRLFYYIALRE